MNRSSEQLDQARRLWLQGLARRHASEGTAESAFELASGLHKCGDYDAALAQFIAARELAPDNAGLHLAVIRSASALGRRDVEDAALERARALLLATPALALHGALRCVPGDLAAAHEQLQAFPTDAACREYDQALTAVENHQPLAPDASGDDARSLARRDSLHWVQRHSRDASVFTGLPVDVLRRAIAAAPRTGLTIECGVYFGRSLRLIAAATDGAVHGFDSFQGLPEAWNEAEGAGAYSTAGRVPEVPGNVQLHAGWFEDTLPPFFAAHPGPIRLLHIDCDLYSSTRTVLSAAAPGLVPGSVVVFDDLLGYPGYEGHELKALEEFTETRGLRWELVAAALLGREVAIRIT